MSELALVDDEFYRLLTGELMDSSRKVSYTVAHSPWLFSEGK